MGLFEKVFRPKKNKAINEAYQTFSTLTAYQPAFTTWQGGVYESELVRAAIDARARHISKLKVEMIGSAQPVLQQKMRYRPNPWSTWSQFLRRVSTILDTNNTAVIVPVLDDRLNTVGYFPVLPEFCTLVEYNNEIWIRYQLANGKFAMSELKKSVILTQHQYKDDFFGTDNSCLNETMNLMSIVNQGIEEAVKGSNSYQFMAELSNFADSEDVAEERQRFTTMNFDASAENKRGLLLFPNTYKNPKQITTTPYKVDAQEMAEIRTNVFNYFGVNEKILQNSAKGDDLDAFFNGAIEPFAIQFSEAMTNAIYSDREQAQGSLLLANANRLQYMTTSEKVAMARELGDRGAIMIDEIRELFNYAPLPNGAGQHAPIRGEYGYAGEGKYSEDDIGNVNDDDKGDETDGE